MQSKLNEWKLENNIIECCAIHHKDDTEEVKAYNDAHYERWGFIDNGIFIEGQYVQFMTKSARSSHHHKGKRLSEETKAKISNALKGENSPNYGKNRPEDTKEKISNKQCENMKAIKLLYSVYKNNNDTKSGMIFKKQYIMVI